MTIMDFLRGKPAERKSSSDGIELSCACAEYEIRKLCFAICVNMIAAAIGRCEFRTYVKGEERKDYEYYLWNVEPNTNQNSTAFLHKLIWKLYEDNAALILETKKKDGEPALVVADSYTTGDEYPTKMTEYKDVRVGAFEYRKTFREDEVLYIRLNQKNVRPVLDGITRSYERAAEAARKYYVSHHGGKLKLHVDAVEANQEGFAEALKKKVEQQVRPFFENDNAVLPEFDGYHYENFGGEGAGSQAEVKAFIDDIFAMTAQALLIPVVLANGTVEATGDANHRFMSNVIDPICDQITEEAIRKRYGFTEWKAGNFIRIDTSSIQHFDIFQNAANVEKIVGSALVTVNDIRRAANMEEINEDWANTHYLTKNISTVDEAVNAVGGN